MKTGSIYIIKNKINDKVYIGQTTLSVCDRFKTHMKPSVRKIKKGYKIYSALNKYGSDNFYYEIIEENIPESQLNKKEIEYIELFDSYNNGYNSTKGGDGRTINKIKDHNLVLELAKEGYTSFEIASLFNVNNVTVLRLLKKLGFKYSEKYIKEEDLKKLIEMGYSNIEMAEKLNVNVGSISRARDKYGIRAHKKPIKIRSDIDFKSIEKDYYENVKIDEICKKHNISKTTFYRIKSDLKLKNRTQIYKNMVNN